MKHFFTKIDQRESCYACGVMRHSVVPNQPCDQRLLQIKLDKIDKEILSLQTLKEAIFKQVEEASK